MKMKQVLAISVAVVFVAGCSQTRQPGQASKLAEFPLNSVEEVIDRHLVVLDRAVSSDGSGSIKVEFDKPATIHLGNFAAEEIANSRLIYRARVKGEYISGRAYLEMLCFFEDQGEFFSRDLQSPVTGTTDWTTEETYFFLKEGENPDMVRLNLIVEGEGTVWVDDISLLRAEL